MEGETNTFVNEGLSKVVFVGCRKIICKIILRQTHAHGIMRHIDYPPKFIQTFLLAKFERSKLKFL